MATSTYRRVRSIPLRPAFTSLGLPPTQFKAGAGAVRRGFSAALNAPGDLLWLFKGSDFFTYDLRARQMLRGPEPIATHWRHAIPPSFGSGIDAAVWAGELFPKVYFMFKESQFIRIEKGIALAPAGAPPPRPERGLRLTEGPRDFVGEWGCTDEACFLVDTPTAAVHGIREHAGLVHFFIGTEYLRHNLRDGRIVAGPGPAGEHFDLPADFGPVELAFYGTGPDEEVLFLFSGAHCATLDMVSGRRVAIDPIEKLFGELALHVARPQAFLVDDYQLDVHEGPVSKGRFVDSIITQRRSKTVTVLVTEVVSTALTKLNQNMLQSDATETTREFYERLEKKQDVSSSADTYRYRMQALFHGDASATGVWGGEVNAQLAVQGGSDAARQAFAQSAFETIGAQVRDSSQSVTFRSMSEEQFEQFQGTVFKSETRTIDNLQGDRTLETHLFEVLIPNVALLVLRNVRAALTDGMTTPQVFPLGELPARLADALVDGSQALVDQIVAYVRDELGRVRNENGQVVSLLTSGDGAGIQVDGDRRFTYTVRLDPRQTIEGQGVVKSATETLQPLYAMTSEDVVSA